MDEEHKRDEASGLKPKAVIVSKLLLVSLHIKCILVLLLLLLPGSGRFAVAAASADQAESVWPAGQISDRLQARRRQSQATLLSHKQNLLTGSANSPLTSPYNQFYLTNNVNSPHNGKSMEAKNQTKGLQIKAEL